MKIGFTGTRLGMTPKQKETLDEYLNGPDFDSDENHELHHGDCVGADYEAARIARFHFFHVVAHPASDVPSTLRGNAKSDVVLEPKPALERNQDIVDACDLLIACSSSMEEKLRSGTWHTFRCAVRARKRRIIIYPDGSREEHAQ